MIPTIGEMIGTAVLTIGTLAFLIKLLKALYEHDYK